MVKDKAVIVTGAGRGIGRAIARRLSAAGASVAIVARSEGELSETQRMMTRGGGRCLALRADVSRVDDVERIVEETVRAFGRIDVLVNNAGVAPSARIDEMEPEQFDSMVATNIRSVFLCCRTVWPRMRTAGGVIVNISSIAADDPFPGFSAYGGTKAFVNTFSKALNAEGAELGIRVYAVAPGAVETQMLRGPFPDFPVEKALQADDVATLIEGLLGPAGTYISGQTITIRKP